MNDKLFRSIVVLNGDTLTDVANAIGISRSTLSLKLNNKLEWNLQEVKKFKKAYSLDAQQIEDIFLS